jgi:hypothetical protein
MNAMKRSLLLLVVLIPFFSLAKYRPIDLLAEIKSAAYVGEVIFTGYDSVKVSKYTKRNPLMVTDPKTGQKYADTLFLDSLYIIKTLYIKTIYEGNSILTIGNCNAFSRSVYVERPDRLPGASPSHGFWPAIGDTCLVVIGSNYLVSVFASLDNNQYIFWDPYTNSSNTSIFAFDDPFKPLPGNTQTDAQNTSARNLADSFGRAYGSHFHCTVDKDVFWKEVMKRQPQAD